MAGIDASELSPDNPHEKRSLTRAQRAKAWKGRWYGLPPDLRKQLRDGFGNDRQKYFRSYQPDEEDICFSQEAGMQYFVKQERKLLSQMRVKPYLAAGRAAMQSLGAAMTSDGLMEQANVTFVSIDFEGTVTHKGITEFGLTMANPGCALSSREHQHISCVNYKVKSHHGKPKFLFGETVRISSELLSRTIVESFSEVKQENKQCKIILVCHGILNELRILDDLGIYVESLQVTGMIDTNDLAFNVLGARTPLEHLLVVLSIPARLNWLHCAGNDAHYTMQVLLALLQITYAEGASKLEALARPKLAALPNRDVKEEADDDWADNFQLDACQLPSED